MGRRVHIDHRTKGSVSGGTAPTVFGVEHVEEETVIARKKESIRHWRKRHATTPLKNSFNRQTEPCPIKKESGNRKKGGMLWGEEKRFSTERPRKKRLQEEAETSYYATEVS